MRFLQRLYLSIIGFAIGDPDVEVKGAEGRRHRRAPVASENASDRVAAIDHS